eukprot:gene20306-31255_t
MLDVSEEPSWVTGAVVYALYKPRGMLTSNKVNPNLATTHRRACMGAWEGELAAAAGVDRVFHVGRLDKKTTGLIFSTNRGWFERFVCTPGMVRKEYIAVTDREATEDMMQQLRCGVQLADGLAVATEAEILSVEKQVVDVPGKRPCPDREDRRAKRRQSRRELHEGVLAQKRAGGGCPEAFAGGTGAGAVSPVPAEEPCPDGTVSAPIHGKESCSDGTVLAPIHAKESCSDGAVLAPIHTKESCSDSTASAPMHIHGKESCSDGAVLAPIHTKESCSDSTVSAPMHGKESCSDGTVLAPRRAEGTCAASQGPRAGSQLSPPPPTAESSTDSRGSPPLHAKDTRAADPVSEPLAGSQGPAAPIEADSSDAAAPRRVEKATSTIRLVISIGRRHIVKKMLHHVGLSVTKLHRSAIGSLSLDTLKLTEHGQSCRVQPEQLRALWQSRSSNNVSAEVVDDEN